MTDRGLRQRLPTIIAEAVSVVFAVLLALAVDEWWEERENIQLAERTADAVAQEIRENRQQLLDAQPGVDPGAQMAALDSAIAAFRAGREPESLGVNWNVALLSSAAWETAQLTRATQYMELDPVLRLARLYELQRFFTLRQDQLVDVISGLGARIETEPVKVLQELQGRLRLVLSLQQTLTTSYACTLVEMEGPGVVEEGACPGGPGG